MKNFSELKSIVTSVETPKFHEERVSSDDMCRFYNNMWSMMTQTHMDLTETGRRLITGRAISDGSFDKILDQTHIGNACLSTGTNKTIRDFLTSNKFKLVPSTINGQQCYELVSTLPISPVKVDVKEGRIDSPEMDELLKDIGLEMLYIEQNGRDFRLWSDDPQWQKLLKQHPEANIHQADSFNSHTTQEWMQWIDNVLGSLV